MPVYEYECISCGTFTEMKPMTEYNKPCDCPECGEASERIIMTVPAMADMDPVRRNAFATNEKSSHAPHHSTKDSRAHKHGPGCSCCSGSKKKSSAVHGADGSKTFPSKRPWMISH